MRKPKTYTVDNVYNATMVGFDIGFKSKKDVNFLLDDIGKILVNQVIFTVDVNTIASYNPVLCIEYKSIESKYILKIPQGCYVTLKHRISQLISYIHNNCNVDIFSFMKVYLSFNDSQISGMYKIQNMDIFRYLIEFDEDYINKYLPNKCESYNSMSVKFLRPLANILLDTTVKINVDAFAVPKETYYGVDLSNQTYGILIFNYIMGENWTIMPNNIINILEYYIMYTFKQLNTLEYSKQGLETLGDMRDKYSKTRMIMRNFNSYSTHVNNYNLDLPNIFVNLSNDVNVVQSFWSKIYNNLYGIIYTNGVNGGDINYDGDLDRMQITNSKVCNVSILLNYDLINCEVENSILIGCRIYNTKVRNSRVINSVLLESSTLYNTYSMDNDIDDGCLIEKTYYVNKSESVFKGDSKDSIIKYCDISNMSLIDDKTIIINKMSNETMYKDSDTTEELTLYNVIN